MCPPGQSTGQLTPAIEPGGTLSGEPGQLCPASCPPGMRESRYVLYRATSLLRGAANPYKMQRLPHSRRAGRKLPGGPASPTVPCSRRNAPSQHIQRSLRPLPALLPGRCSNSPIIPFDTCSANVPCDRPLLARGKRKKKRKDVSSRAKPGVRAGKAGRAGTGLPAPCQHR